MNSDKLPPSNEINAILAQLNDIASAVMYAAEASNLEEVLERIAEVARNLVNARYAALGIPDDNGRLKYFKVSGITPQEMSHLDHLPRGYGLLGAIARERRSIRLEKMQDDARFAGFCGGHPHMTSFLGVPIQVGQRLFGILYLCDRVDRQPFTEQDEWLIETAAGYAALAIAGSQLGQQQSRLTLLEERDRISMELHDGVIQSLYAMGMNLDILRMNGGASSDELRSSVQNVNLVIDDIRRYIMDLRRSDQHKKTIYDCLNDILKHLRQSNGARIELDAPGEIPLLASVTFDAVCQMVNEAISNALRHAEATTINVVAVQSASVFQVTIADDGKGFELNMLPSHSGLGLRNIQQRAALNGGQVIIETAPTKGTRLVISVPIKAG